MELTVKNGGGKRTLFFFYLSIIIHLYILSLLLYLAGPDALQRLLRPELFQAANNPTNENIVVETVTSSDVTPDHGKISDNPNIDSGKKSDRNDYNYVNTEVKKSQNNETAVMVDESKKDGAVKNTAAENGGQDAVADKQKQSQSQQQQTVQDKQDAGDYHTSFFDPDKPASVTMNSSGDLSLATVPSDLAPYFLNMQKIIRENWQSFFPVFQYYQGIIKSGEVDVVFQINEDGSIGSSKIIRSYGYSVIDQACLNAVVYSRNFGPLPDKLKKLQPVVINFKFIYVAR